MRHPAGQPSVSLMGYPLPQRISRQSFPPRPVAEANRLRCRETNAQSSSATKSALNLLQWLQAGEQNRIPNTFRPGQQDDQTIDPEPHPAGRRHPVLQRGQKVGVHVLLFFTHLRFKHFALHQRIILLGVSGGDFLAVDAQLKDINRGRIVLCNLSQRAQFAWDVRDEGRLNQGRLDQFFKDVI